MPFKKYIKAAWYAAADYLTASIAWTIFYFIRKIILGQTFSINYKFWLGVFLIPVGWLILYALLGSYNSIYKKSRLAELTRTFICSIFGCVVLFFTVILDDVKNDYSYYYAAFGSLMALQFFFTLAGRLVILTIAKRQLVRKYIQFRA